MADTGDTEKQPTETNEEELEGRKDLFRALIFCLLAVAIVRSFLFEPFKIPSSSMVPTLQIGDHIFVSKFNFGLTLPFSKIEFVRWSSPERGDVIVFLFPRDESLHYIKRVVGLPGDTVELDGKDLIINGNTIPKEPISDASIIEPLLEGSGENVEFYKETLGNSVHFVQYSKNVN